MYRFQLASHGMGAGACLAISGIDMALWDIRAKAAGVPLYRLLGGARKGVPAYAGGVSLGYQPPDELIEEARTSLARGYKAVKLRVGDSPARDVERMRAVRAGLRPVARDPHRRQHRLLGRGRAARDAGDGRARHRLARGALPRARLPQLPRSARPRAHAARRGREPLHPLRVQPRDRGRRDHDPAARPVEVRRHHRGAEHRRHGLGLQAADPSRTAR